MSSNQPNIAVLDRVREIAKRVIGDKLPGPGGGGGIIPKPGGGGLLPTGKNGGILSGKDGLLSGIGQGKFLKQGTKGQGKILENLPSGGGQIMSTVQKTVDTARRRVSEAQNRVIPMAKEKGSMIKIRSGGQSSNKGIRLPTSQGTITDISSSDSIALGD